VAAQMEELVFSNEPSPGTSPVKIEELNETHTGVRIYDENSKLNLDKIAGIVGFDVGDVHKGLVQETSRSKTVTGEEGSAETWGVSVRLAVATSKWDVKASVTIPAIAAAAELNLATASAAIDVKGYRGDLSAMLPKPTSLDVTSYTAYVSAFGEIQQKVFADLANGEPELLGRTPAPDRTY
jgi:hypothetical protein